MFHWDGLVWVVLELCPAVVPCATTDGESGSSLKTWTPGYYKIWFSKRFSVKINPYINYRFSANLTVTLSLIYLSILFWYNPSMGVVGLAEYVCTHPTLTFYRRRPRLRARRRWVGLSFCTQPCLWNRPCRDAFAVAIFWARAALDPMWFAVWCYVVAWLLIIIICIECPPRFVRLWTIWCNKCGISLLGLVFCITFKFSLMRGRFNQLVLRLVVINSLAFYPYFLLLLHFVMN